MSFRRMKACLLTAAVAGLFGASATPASAFGGKLAGLFNRGCNSGCAPAASDCGGCGSGAAAAAPAAGGAAAAPAASGTASAPAAAPAMKTVKVTEYVPTWVEETRNVWKNESRQETYTAYKTEMVQEQRTRNVTVNRMVTETVMETRTVRKPVTETVMETRNVTKKVPVQTMETRTVTKRVPVTKTVTVNETKWETQQVTEMRSRTVRNVSNVSTEVTVGPGLMDRLKGICDPCHTACPKTVTVCKKQVSRDTVCEPVTVCKKVKVCVPVTKQVCSYECVTEQVQVPVCKWECKTETVQVPVCKKSWVCETVQVPVCKTRCVPETKTETYTVCVKKCVPYQATRTVCHKVCVPETHKVCKMVATVVEKQVADTGCGNGCGNACGNACGNSCGHDACSRATPIRDLLARVKAKLSGLLCHSNRDHGCHSGCDAAPACGGCK
jgi:hypothetical protein